MASLNKVILIGNLGKDPELKYTPSNQAVCTFSLATTEKWTDKQGQKQESTEWHNIVVWGKTAELANQYLKKGRSVYIEGKIQTRSWEDRDGVKKYRTEIIVTQMQFLGSAPSQNNNNSCFGKDPYADFRNDAPAPNNTVEEDLPF